MQDLFGYLSEEEEVKSQDEPNCLPNSVLVISLSFLFFPNSVFSTILVLKWQFL